MKKKTKIVWGIILLVLGIIAIIGRGAENIGNGRPWYVFADTDSQTRIGLTLNFMLFVGGILLLIPTKETKKKDITPPVFGQGTGNCIGVPNVTPNFAPNVSMNVPANDPPTKKNGLCIAAFVVGIIGCFSVGRIAVPVLSVTALILACIGMKQAHDQDQGGKGLGKWALTLSISAILGILCWLIMSGANLIEPGSEKAEPDIYDKLKLIDTTKTQSDDIINKEKEYSKGIATSDSYESEFVGLRFTPPENWVMRTEDEMTELFGDGAEECEMGVFNAVTNESVNLLVEKLQSKNMTIDQCVKAVENTFSGSGMTLASDDGTIDFNGEEYRNVIFDINQNGMTVKTELYLRKEGNRLIYLMLQYLDGNRANVEPALNAFSQY